MVDRPVSVAEHIDILDGLIAAGLADLSSTDPVVIARARGRLGRWRLQRFELRQEPDDLLTAIDDLEAAIAGSDGDPETTLLRFRLGWAYSYLAEATELLVHVEKAIAALERARSEQPHPDVPPDDLLVDLAELYADRHALTEPSRPAADEAVNALAGLAASAPTGEYGRYLGMLLGDALLARHEAGGPDDDLSRSIDLLVAAIDLPGTMDRVSDASISLVRALKRRYDREGSRDDLERAIHISAYMSLRASPYDPNSQRLRLMHSMLLYELWERERDGHDLDAAVISARTVVDEARRAELPDLVKTSVEHLADLLIERGEQTTSPVDLDEAAELYDLVCAALDPDREDAWLPRLHAAVARFTHWQLTGSADLRSVVARLDAAIEAGIPDADLCLAAQSMRYSAFANLREREIASGLDDREWLGRRIRAMIDEAERSLARLLDADIEARATLAGLASISWCWLGPGNPHDVEPARVRALLDIAEQMPDPPGVWRQLVALVAGALGALESGLATPMAGGNFGGPALAEALAIEGDPSVHAMLVDMLALTRVMQATWRGDLGLLDIAAQALRVGADGTVRRQSPDDEGTVAMARMAAMLGRGDYANARQAASDALRAWAQVPGDHPAVAVPRRFVGLVHSLLRVMAGEPTSFDTTEPDDVLGALQTAARVAVGSGSMADLRAAAERVPADHSMRGEIAGLVAQLALYLAGRPGSDDDDLDSAIAWAAEARRRMGGPRHPLWSHVGISLANAHRLRGMRRRDHHDLARSREIALDALRGHSWLVLLQSGTEHAMIAARNAAAQAYDVAAWCLADGLAARGSSAKREVLSQLLRALDAGRGLVLHAATTTRQAADWLAELGHTALATAWRDHLNRRAPSDPVAGLALSTDDATYQALRALTDAGGDAAAALVDPPEPGDIASALSTAGADALVYLVAGRSTVPGYAAIVTADAKLDVMRLGSLRADANPLNEFIEAHRGLTSRKDESARTWRGAFDQVCRWAWVAAMADVLAWFRSLSRHRVPRLVLVPVGALAVVPWSAAWRDSRGGRRYAVQDVVLSLAASARQLCDAVVRGPLPPGDALVIGDPDGTLPAAGVEARAIHAVFYPTGRYLGQPIGHGDGAGTAEQVLAWLRGPATARHVLHMACHGVVEPERPAASYLLLAGGQKLAVGDLMAASRSAETQLGTVVLAACATNVSGERHDEALSLANAFLAAGARSAIASLWVVPDVSTGLFMFMLHHHMREHPDDPAGALRQTQLWMLNPAREAPPTMPERMRVRVTRLTARDPGTWAAFVHVGVPTHRRLP